MTEIAVVGLILGAVSLVRTRIERWPLTAPMLFVAAGLVLGPDGLNVLQLELEDESVALAVEVTLAMLLFSDAARIDTRSLGMSWTLPARLLGIGLPLTVIVGAVVTTMLLTELTWQEATLVAAILSPTDAALGQAVVSDARIPVRIRQALNVESGLNDGLIVPVVAVFGALAVGDELEGAGSVVGEALVEIAIGLGMGVGIGILLGVLIPWIADRGWSDGEGIRLVTLGGALGAWAGSAALGGNGFIAAFVCGLTLHLKIGMEADRRVELTEDVGQVGAAAAFVIFGALMVWPALGAVGLAVALCAIATLTVGRMAPVAVSMIGAGLKAPTVLFLGWFGPRGLASMLFGLLIVAERGEEADQLFSIITVVVVASVILHGITAAPGAGLYSDWFAVHGRSTMAEAATVSESRVRWSRQR